MNRFRSFLDQALAVLKRAASAVRKQPFGVLAALTGLLAAVLAALLPWQLPRLIDDIVLAAARRIAATGFTESDPIRAEVLSLLIRTVAAMVLYLVSVWAALRSARKLRTNLRDAVQNKRKAHESAGHTPPPDWDKDVNRDIDHLCASVAAAPEWLMLLTGLVVCVALFTRAPLLPALTPPVVALLACCIRDALRIRRAPRAMQTAAVTALWAAGTLGIAAYMLLQTENAPSLGTVTLVLLAMTLLVPAALQLPYRNLRPTAEALRRIRGFLR